MAIGQNDFKEEQRSLLFGTDGINTTEYHRFQHTLDPFNSQLAMNAFHDGSDDSFGCAWSESNLKHLPYIKMPHDGISAVDILVCTPGKLLLYASFDIYSFHSGLLELLTMSTKPLIRSIDGSP